MNKIRGFIELTKKFDYVLKILKAAIAGFETFQAELDSSLAKSKLNEEK